MTIEVKLSPEQLEELASRVAEKLASRRPAEPAAMLTVREAAGVARLHRATIRARILDGSIPAVRAGRDWRIRRDDLDRFLRGQDAA
jgi:excisionase family DNA binding protein